MSPAKVDRTQRIVEKARRAVEQAASPTLNPGPSPSGRGENGGGNGGTGGQGSPGGESIQDGAGNMRWMWGVSVWTEGGGDVFADS
jgi:hypothetical protein